MCECSRMVDANDVGKEGRKGAGQVDFLDAGNREVGVWRLMTFAIVQGDDNGSEQTKTQTSGKCPVAYDEWRNRTTFQGSANGR